jgi:YggT family protein
LRRVIPPIGGIDLTVLVALILLQVLQMVLGRIFI